MKKYMLFTREIDGGFNTFQGDYDTMPEAFDAALTVGAHCMCPFTSPDEDIYKIISSKTNSTCAEGPVKNLIKLLPPGDRVGMDLLLSPSPPG